MIEVKNLTAAYGGVTVLENCSLSIPQGVHAALMGPSGCGKTTLLSIISGLLKPVSGQVSVHGRVSCVFQDPRLFPWLTAKQNIAVVLSGRESEKLAEAERWLKSSGLSDAGGKYPHELSGGMRQRISICRALAYGGDVLLLDEPLKGMDQALRREISGLIADNSAGKTVLLVTHDESEAAELSDNIYDYSDKTFIER